MAERITSVDPGQVYERTRQAMVSTVAQLTAHQLTRIVPATPDWRVRDVVAHVCGLAADLNAQRFPAADDVGGAAWSAQQVAQRRDLPLEDVLAEWAREAPAFEDGLRLFGYVEGSHFVADLHAHHQDVRGALGLSRDDDPLTVAVALDHYVGYLGELLSDATWGTVEIVAGGETRVAGSAGRWHARLVAPPFEVLRALSARRSAVQVRALDWTGDADALVALLQSAFAGGYALPTADVHE
jgi:hypothetical protein